MEYFTTPEELEVIENFEGALVPIMRDLIRRKRLSLSASYQQLGSVLQISWSTIHKWETGSTGGCHTRHVQLIRRFLKGYYDKQVLNMTCGFNNNASVLNTFPDEIKDLIERLNTIMRINSNHPERNNKLTNEINEIINQNIKSLLGQK